MMIVFKVQSLMFKGAVGAMVLSFVASVGAVTTNSVQTTNAPAAKTNTNTTANSGSDLSSFKIISERNIFSANRSGRVSSRGAAPKPKKIDTFTLVGTVDYSKGMFAIFEGSSSSFRKTVKTGDSFAGFQIKDIDLDHVTIATTNSSDKVLRVGTQMRRVDEGDWELGAGPAPEVTKASNDDAEKPKAQTDNSDNADDPPPSAETNDILKKLMQKRKAEVKNESE